MQWLPVYIAFDWATLQMFASKGENPCYMHKNLNNSTGKGKPPKSITGPTLKLYLLHKCIKCIKPTLFFQDFSAS